MTVKFTVDADDIHLYRESATVENVKALGKQGYRLEKIYWYQNEWDPKYSEYIIKLSKKPVRVKEVRTCAVVDIYGNPCYAVLCDVYYRKDKEWVHESEWWK